MHCVDNLVLIPPAVINVMVTQSEINIRSFELRVAGDYLVVTTLLPVPIQI
jgi:hypothetical protein